MMYDSTLINESSRSVRNMECSYDELGRVGKVRTKTCCLPISRGNNNGRNG